nr:uncharacterized protein CI109_002026 [Kwoniella shandongensis]KAA5529601.1 hypothetical protein CI109_002026 [Kwoniella shandongensis]
MSTTITNTSSDSNNLPPGHHTSHRPRSQDHELDSSPPLQNEGSWADKVKARPPKSPATSSGTSFIAKRWKNPQRSVSPNLSDNICHSSAGPSSDDRDIARSATLSTTRDVHSIVSEVDENQKTEQTWANAVRCRPAELAFRRHLKKLSKSKQDPSSCSSSKTINSDRPIEDITQGVSDTSSRPITILKRPAHRQSGAILQNGDSSSSAVNARTQHLDLSKSTISSHYRRSGITQSDKHSHVQNSPVQTSRCSNRAGGSRKGKVVAFDLDESISQQDNNTFENSASRRISPTHDKRTLGGGGGSYWIHRKSAERHRKKSALNRSGDILPSSSSNDMEMENGPLVPTMLLAGRTTLHHLKRLNDIVYEVSKTEKEIKRTKAVIECKSLELDRMSSLLQECRLENEYLKRRDRAEEGKTGGVESDITGTRSTVKMKSASSAYRHLGNHLAEIREDRVV